MRRARAFLAAFATALLVGGGVRAQERDLFDYLIEANQAQLVMLVEQELIDEILAGRIAAAMADHAEAERREGAARSRNYLLLEEALVAAVGPEASNLHLGRSRYDLGAAMNRMRLRDELRSLLRAQIDARAALLDLAGAHLETVMPGFTHAVQAQPTTLGHYLLAIDDALSRDAARLREAYARVNQSPLGSAAITTSGFAIDRDRLAELLAFDGLVENSYDAIVIATGDSKIEVANAASVSAITVGRFAKDVLFQYDDPAPGLVLSEDVAGRSSIMPQKRNPSLVEQLRVDATDVVGRAHTATLLAHNTPLHEVRDTRQPLADHLSALLVEAERMYERLAALARSLEVRPERLSARVDADFSTMTEVADALHREADIPFRDGYQFASQLAAHGRSTGQPPGRIPFEEAAAVYRETRGTDLPLTPEQFRAALNARAIVRDRAGRGGPQPSEARRMLNEARAEVADLEAWLAREGAAIEERSAALAGAVDALIGERTE